MPDTMLLPDLARPTFPARRASLACLTFQAPRPVVLDGLFQHSARETRSRRSHLNILFGLCLVRVRRGLLVFEALGTDSVQCAVSS